MMFFTVIGVLVVAAMVFCALVGGVIAFAAALDRCTRVPVADRRDLLETRAEHHARVPERARLRLVPDTTDELAARRAARHAGSAA